MNNLRNALRQLRKRPGLAALVIFMLAFGIGATTAIFSLYQQILLRPLPVPQPDRLVNLRAPGPQPGNTSCTTSGSCDYVFSYPMFRDLKAGQRVFTGLAGYTEFNANLSYAGETLSGGGLLVSGSYFDVLRIKAATGRLIAPRDEPRVGESDVVVLSHEYWRNRFGANPDVVGHRLMVNGRRLTIIGIAPAGFTGTTIGLHPDVFVPLTLRWLMQPSAPQDQNNHLSYWVYAFARLKPGASVAQASASINSLYSGIINKVEAPLASFLGKDRLRAFRAKRIHLEPGARGESSVPGLAREPLTLLFGVTVLLLLIVCVNVANLLLARGASRAGEMAVRTSVGASGRQLVSQLLAEAGVLAALGGAASVPVAAGVLTLVGAILPNQGRAPLSLGLDGASLLFAAGAALATVLLCGLLPAIRSARADLGLVIKGYSSQSVGARGTSRFRTGLATTQIGFSMVLLVLAGLFARSLMNVARIDLGMNVDSLVAFTVSPRLNGYDKQRVMSLYARIETALRTEPDVVDVATSKVPLLTNTDWSNNPFVKGFEHTQADTNALVNEVGPGFFSTLSIPLLAGRDFTNDDRLGSPRVAIVNERFLQKFKLGGPEEAIGKRFGDYKGISSHPTRGSKQAPTRDIQIVGVVADAKYSTVKGEAPPQYFLPRRQDDNLGTLTFYLRARIEPSAVLRLIPRVVKRIDPNLPVSHLTTMRRTVESNVFLDRFVTLLSASFAALATLLAAIGLYGVLAYNVGQRTREIGLRLALGATPAQLRAMVLTQVGIMAVIGGGVGLVAAIGLGRAAAAMLYQLSGYDPAVLAASVFVLGAVVLAAGLVPALRASRVEPMAALRYE